MKSLKELVFGEVIEDWSACFFQQRGIVTEECGVALYRRKGETSVVFKVKHKVLFSPNVWFVEIGVTDLPRFVATLRSSHRALDELAHAPAPSKPAPRDRIRFGGRLMLSVIYGIKTSRLLLDSKDPCSDGSLDIYGFVTRKSETRILLAPSHITSKAGWVFSGDALDACLEKLSGHLEGKVA